MDNSNSHCWIESEPVLQVMYCTVNVLTHVSSPLCRRFSQNTIAQLWYFVKCIYFGLSAYQIRCGYPTRILGNFLTKSYNYLNLFLFQGWETAVYRVMLYVINCMFTWNDTIYKKTQKPTDSGRSTTLFLKENKSVSIHNGYTYLVSVFNVQGFVWSRSWRSCEPWWTGCGRTRRSACLAGSVWRTSTHTSSSSNAGGSLRR